MMGIEKVLTMDPFHMIEGQTTSGSTADEGSPQPWGGIPTTMQQLNVQETSMQSNPTQEVTNTAQEVSGQSNTVPEVNVQPNTAQEVKGQSNTAPKVNVQSNTAQEVNVESKTELLTSYPTTGSEGGGVVSPSLRGGDLEAKDGTDLSENKNGTSLVTQEMRTRSSSQNGELFEHKTSHELTDSIYVCTTSLLYTFTYILMMEDECVRLNFTI